MAPEARLTLIDAVFIEEYDQAMNRVEESETRIEDLKLQLDDALGAEDMLEQLTERNLTLTEQLEDLKATVDDLEALKELNDELEDNHVETQKQLLEEIAIKERAFGEQSRRVELLEESVVDYEATISQFRDLVTSLQRQANFTRLSYSHSSTATWIRCENSNRPP